MEFINVLSDECKYRISILSYSTICCDKKLFYQVIRRRGKLIYTLKTIAESAGMFKCTLKTSRGMLQNTLTSPLIYVVRYFNSCEKYFELNHPLLFSQRRQNIPSLSGKKADEIGRILYKDINKPALSVACFVSSEKPNITWHYRPLGTSQRQRPKWRQIYSIKKLSPYVLQLKIRSLGSYRCWVVEDNGIIRSAVFIVESKLLLYFHIQCFVSNYVN